MAGVINGLLYLTTGQTNGSGWANLLDVYDPATDTWTGLAGSSAAHSAPAGGVINGKLYVAGGSDGVDLVAGVEAYNPSTNAWTALASMPSPVYAAASAVIDGKLYAFGGNNNPSPVATVQVYDPIKNTWSVTTPSLPAAINFAQADLLYGVAFVVGGSNSGYQTVGTNDLYVQCPSIP